MRQRVPPEGVFAGALKHPYVPILIQDDGSYPVEAHRHLDARCNDEWLLPGSDQTDPVVPALTSRRNSASRWALLLNGGTTGQSDWHQAHP